MRKRLLTPKFQAVEPHVWEKHDGRYSLVAVFAPSGFSTREREQWQAMVAAVMAAQRDGFALPFEPMGGGHADTISLIMATSARRPAILDRDGDLIDRTRADEFCLGCYARASIHPYTNFKLKAVMVMLCNLQKLVDYR